MMCRWWRLALVLGLFVPSVARAAAPANDARPAAPVDRSRPADSGWLTKSSAAPTINAASRTIRSGDFDRERVRLDEALASVEAKTRSTAAPATMTLPGEFERQAAIVLGCGQLASFAPETLAEVVAATRGQADVIALAPDAPCRQEVLRALHKRKLPADAVQFVAVRHDTMWARDYGPLLVRRADGSPALVDANYAESQRFADDAVPLVLGRRFGMPVVEAPLAIEGGNLLSNGRGLCITTRKVLEHNLENDATEAEVRATLREFYGAETAVFLEPLDGEATGHVDMFACFTAPNVVVVGKYDPAVDPKNAAILDRNAESLAGLRTAAGPLRVERVPMPSNEDGVWRTFTNVVFANGVVLVPSYDRDAAARDEALAVYRRLLPERKVIAIDASAIITMGGALHCLSLNLTELDARRPLEGATELSDARASRTYPARRPRRGR